MKNVLQIKKASGDTVQFSEFKLRNSLARSGASSEQINTVINEIYPRLFEGIESKKIYQMAFALLKNKARHLAAKYHLKKAIMELGPSGYPFEKYMGEIFRKQGYQVKIGQTISGKCVQHEVDVVAEIENKKIMVECKYHNQPGIYCDVKIPLYIHARFKDIEAQWIQSSNDKNKLYEGCVVTNTRFSSDAILYGNCVGLKLIGWDYPLNQSLKESIDKLNLYPITCLTSLTKVEKQRLLDKKIVLCKELENNIKLLEEVGVKQARINTVLKETHQLCLQLNH